MSLFGGLLNLNKPSGITSRAAVDRVQQLARPMKAGHAGTLDPLASGVLVVGVGAATRLLEFIQQMPKTYAATFLLGRRSATEDIDSEVTLLEHAPVPSFQQVVEAAQTFVGEIQQIPPEFSALRVAGRRAYDLARRGEPVSLQARKVMVYRIEVQEYAYPEVRILLTCGSGTYVRSLGRDLAARLGTSAVMSGLTRTAIGQFHLCDAVDPAALTAENWQSSLLSPLRAVEHLPRVTLTDHEVRRVGSGQSIRFRVSAFDPAATHFAALDSAGRLVAILVRRGPELLGPSRVMASVSADKPAG